MLVKLTKRAVLKLNKPSNVLENVDASQPPQPMDQTALLLVSSDINDSV